MKHQILLKSFLFLTLIFTFSLVAHASEVAGNLSSVELISLQNTSFGGSTIISSNSGVMSGTVSGGVSSSSNINGTSLSSGGGGRGIIGNTGNAGTVLNTSAIAINLPNNNLPTQNGTAFENLPNNLAQAGGTNNINSTTTAPTLTANEQSNQTASVLNAFGNIGFTSWFWIIFLLFLLVATVIYIYSRNYPKKKVAHV